MTDRLENGGERQRVERVPGARRARLTPAPGSDPAPESGPETGETTGASPDRRPRGPKGPNDDQLLQDVPPHY